MHRRFSKISALAIGLGLTVGLGMVVPSHVSAVPSVVTTQRVYLWTGYPNDPSFGGFLLQREGLDFTIDVPLPATGPLALWATFDAVDEDCDIDRIWQVAESGPPGVLLPFLGGMSAGQIGGTSLSCGGTERIAGDIPGTSQIGYPVIWAGTAGNYLITVPGQYTFRTDVTDLAGNVTSARFGVNVLGTEPPVNNPPFAEIAGIGPVHPGQPMILDGSQSSDPDAATGDMIVSYKWRVEYLNPDPVEVFHGTLPPLAVFTPTAHGNYRVSLTVTDTRGATGTVSVPASTYNTPPVANAGNDISLTEDVLVWVPCFRAIPCRSASEIENRNYDPDGDPITFTWYRLDPNGTWTPGGPINWPTPELSAQLGRDGDFRLRLRVTDSFGAFSEDEVVISLNTNLPPVANAGPDTSVVAGQFATLEGSSSSDPDGDPLYYQWVFTSVPEGSAAVLQSTDSSRASLRTDVVGTYVVTLIVNDGLLMSAPDSIVVTAIGADNEVLVNLRNLIRFINGLSSSEFKKPGYQGKMVTAINAAILEVTSGEYSRAFDLLYDGVFVHSDGCIRGAIDSNDWFVNCGSEGGVLFILEQALYPLGTTLDGDESPALVAVDIKPSVDGNPINPTKDVTVPIAILSNGDFYAPITAGRTVAFRLVDGLGTSVTFDATVKDVNGDGIRDGEFKFPLAATGIACGGPTEAYVSGGSYGGNGFIGYATITLKGCK